MDTLLEYLQYDFANALNVIIPIVIALIVAMIIGILIYYVYAKAFMGVIFSQAFAISLAGMTVLTTMVTLAISGNIALSLGMVGALSIVRFRTAIKDPMDLLFLFWAVASGIAIGAKMHYLAIVCSLIIILMLYVIKRNYSSSNMYILIVHYTGEDIEEDLRKILLGKRYQIKSKTVRYNDVEIAIEISVPDKNLAFVNAIKNLPLVNDVTFGFV